MPQKSTRISNRPSNSKEKLRKGTASVKKKSGINKASKHLILQAELRGERFK